ncbi:MAG TPA: DUF4271 domain-containing protein, partial [Phaeodactylibacter sp.]|nr:DUF4271 domain-containing protein [Phaeodactylibacter sp.]
QEDTTTASPVAATATNPFNIHAKKTVPSNEVTAVEKKTQTTVTHKPSQRPSVKMRTGGSFRFWLITGILVLLTLLYVMYHSYVVKAYRSVMNENFLKMTQRGEGRVVSIPYLLLYLLYFLSMAAFIFLITDHYGWYFFKNPASQYLACLAGVGLMFLVKHFFLWVLSLTFPISKEIRVYSFTIIVFNIILGISLVPFDLFISFAEPGIARMLIYAGLLLILLFYLYRSFRALLIASKYLAMHKFHFFMYLCAVEIAPILFLITILLNDYKQ